MRHINFFSWGPKWGFWPNFWLVAKKFMFEKVCAFSVPYGGRYASEVCRGRLQKTREGCASFRRLFGGSQGKLRESPRKNFPPNREMLQILKPAGNLESTLPGPRPHLAKPANPQNVCSCPEFSSISHLVQSKLQASQSHPYDEMRRTPQHACKKKLFSHHALGTLGVFVLHPCGVFLKIDSYSLLECF